MAAVRVSAEPRGSGHRGPVTFPRSGRNLFVAAGRPSPSQQPRDQADHDTHDDHRGQRSEEPESGLLDDEIAGQALLKIMNVVSSRLAPPPRGLSPIFLFPFLLTVEADRPRGNGGPFCFWGVLSATG